MPGKQLRLARIEGTPEPRVRWKIESPTRGVVLVDVALGPQSPVPYHWRVGLWNKPPLDIELDPGTGAPQALQVVIQDERVPPGALAAPIRVRHRGLPQFDLSLWSDESRYVDENGELTLARSPDQWLEVHLPGADRAEVLYSVDGRLEFLLAAEGGVVAVRFGPLSRTEWSTTGIAATDAGP